MNEKTEVINESQKLAKLLGLPKVQAYNAEIDDEKLFYTEQEALTEGYVDINPNPVCPDFTDPFNFVKLLEIIKNAGKSGTLVQFGDDGIKLLNFQSDFANVVYCKDTSQSQLIAVLTNKDTSTFIDYSTKERNAFIDLLKQAAQKVDWSY